MSRRDNVPTFITITAICYTGFELVRHPLYFLGLAPNNQTFQNKMIKKHISGKTFLNDGKLTFDVNVWFPKVRVIKILD